MVDSHCHLQYPEFDADRQAVLERARRAGVGSLLVVGTDVATSEAALALARQHPGLMATVGCHPHDAGGFDRDGVAAIRYLADDPLAVAIGETGLDFYRNLSAPNAQRAAFGLLLDLAADVKKPVVVHSRNADEETWAILQPWAKRVASRWPPGRPLGVMHCFAGDLPLAMRYTELGFLISIPGPVTYPKAERLLEVARGIPLGAMVVETDAPYLAPQSQRGRRNEPAYLAETARRIAQLRDEPLAAVEGATTANAQRLLGWPEAEVALRPAQEERP